MTLCALLPYWRFLTFGVVFVTDDYFASDIFNGELPGRVLAGQLVRQGQLPAWTHQLCSGLPLAGVAMDPVGMGPFVLFSPAVALDLFVIVLLLVAAHGATDSPAASTPTAPAPCSRASRSPVQATSRVN